jgi:gluconate 2-dehydrogenase gamma chain
MDGGDVSRRSLLEAIVATLITAALGRLAGVEHAVPKGQTPRARVSGDLTLSFLSAADAADVDAVAAHIIPTDDAPGAREVGIVYFIDRALATFLSRLGSDYRAALHEFQAAFRLRHPEAASFALLPSARQIAYLETVDHTSFFEMTRLLTLLGMFSLPGYGGNRDLAGWKLIGFEDRHFFQPPFGHYDRDYPGFGIAGPKDI